jgi:hypothetical protein
MTVTGLADEATGDLLAEHGRPTDLKSQLRQSLDTTAPAGTTKATRKPKVGQVIAPPDVCTRKQPTYR